MSKGERSVIEHILALAGLFRAGPAAPVRRPEGAALEEEQAAWEMIGFMEEMPGGFLIYQAGGDEEIIFANRGLLRIFRCSTMEEFRLLTGNSFRGMVHPDDYPRVQHEIETQIDASDTNMDYVQYRIIRKDGEIRWVDDWGHLETSKYGEENRLFYVFLKDITGEITAVQQEKLLNSNRFYAPECRNTDEEQ